MLVEIRTGKIEQLIACKKNVKGRDFRDWDVEGLLNEAIDEFWKKYGGI